MSATPTRIDQVFEKLRANHQQAFMPFITAGDPDLSATSQLILELGRRGADLIELGFPYSDPTADGPVIQASYTRSLNKGLKVDGIFQMLEALPHAELPPIVAMVSYAIILKIGIEKFLNRSVESGLSGLIVPDLPTEEVQLLKGQCQSRQIDLILLIAPTSSKERVSRIVANASGFIYCIAVAGITGVREQVSHDLISQLGWIRTMTTLPLAVGFGISRPEHVEPLKNVADGIIVGSAIVKMLDQGCAANQPLDQTLNSIGEFVTEMVQTCHTSR
jgi:tryptophan synthase alpha chain